MAHYRGSVKGRGLGEATRLGTKSTGLSVEANGWNTGCIVEIKHEDGYDHVYVYKTGGSNGKEKKNLVADWFENTGDV